MAQLRGLPLWVALVITAFIAASILGSRPGGTPAAVQTVGQAATAFENYELKKGAAIPLHLVQCRPSLETYLCSGVEYKAKDMSLSRNLSVTVEPNGSVTAVILFRPAASR